MSGSGAKMVKMAVGLALMERCDGLVQMRSG